MHVRATDGETFLGRYSVDMPDPRMPVNLTIRLEALEPPTWNRVVDGRVQWVMYDYSLDDGRTWRRLGGAAPHGERKVWDLVRKLLGSHFQADEVPDGLVLPESTSGGHLLRARFPPPVGLTGRRAGGLPVSSPSLDAGRDGKECTAAVETAPFGRTIT